MNYLAIFTDFGILKIFSLSSFPYTQTASK